ncbi:MAG: DNA polymerase III subunit alpha [Rhodospirillales bacterium]|nr:DNA polymerase III subunit alpha [Rhodospirillales bacterium]MCW8952698.1 DNA polymerase III subunit alpha [Rhodospirillales bacterium]
MSHADFVHLRVHTAYSLSEGANRIKDIVGLCRTLGMPALACTDSSNLFGGLEFSGACAAAGVQPIIGAQINVTREAGRESAPGQRNVALDRPDQVVLLVKDETGYRNLLKLFSRAYLDGGDNAEPQVSFNDLAEHGEGLIALTGGPLGPVGRLILEGQNDAAKETLVRLSEAFPGRLYVEIMRHGMDEERKTESGFLDLAYKFDLPLVATNEAFFPTRDMYEAHDALICIDGGTYVGQNERRRLTPEHYFKSPDEMRALFQDLPEAYDNALVVARRCGFMVEKIDPILPPYDCGDGRSEEQELRHQAAEGLEERLKAQIWTPGMSAEEREATAKPYRERLEYELNVIVQMGFPGYFLIVADFIKWSKDNNIPVGPGRGSGAGSVVAWALTITDLDPLRFGLLFERFLNPERVSMPDFDIDFCQDRRDEVIRYVQGKYGRDRVAQIITFGKLQARAVLRDVGRVLEMPYGQVDRICKLVPNNPANPVNLEQAINGEPQLREMIRNEDAVARMVGIARKLEGLYRHASTHAAGVVIGDRPLDELIPLYRDPRSDMPVTQFNMKHVESAGLVKFDFLGLKTLTVLSTALNLIAESGDANVPDLSNLPLDDAKTFEMLGRGDATGVFQLESAGMRDVLRNMRPDTLEDLIAVVALYRPGPMDNIPSYINRKHGAEEPDYLYPTLKPILEETYGIIIYQEQVMQIAQELAGYSLGGADLLRRAMGKKIQSEMDQQRQIFVDGATARGVPTQKASDIFDLVAKFASYGFNKSHAAAYALVAYQTAYLKANFPVEFLAASMTLDINNTDKLNVFRQELDRLGIGLLPPDINRSGVRFRVETVKEGGERKKAIRYALAAIKNVGEGAMEALVQERESNQPFKEPFEFASRLDARQVNKRQLENLVKAGAFDGLNENRRQMFDGIEFLLRHAAAASSDRESSQIGLFGADEPAAVAAAKLPDVPEWALMDRLKNEFDAIGFYLSAHPLDAYGKSLKRLKASTQSEILRNGQSGPVHLVGTVISKKERTSAKGNKFAFVQLSDATGAFEVTIFSDLLGVCRELLEVGQSLFIKASAQFEGENVRYTASSIESLDAVAARTAAGLLIHIDNEAPLGPLKDILQQQGRGRGEVHLITPLGGSAEVTLRLGQGYAISPALFQAVRSIPGIVEVQEI